LAGRALLRYAPISYFEYREFNKQKPTALPKFIFLQPLNRLPVPDWKVQIKNYFIFSKKESRGIFILSLTLLLLVVFNFLLPYLIVEDMPDFTEFENEIGKLKLLEDAPGSTPNDRTFGQPKAGTDYSEKIKPFRFDPNGLPVESWKKLGLDDRQIKVIKNYEAKGGMFRKKEDLASIYSISTEEYRILEPYISIKPSSPDGQPEKESAQIKPFDFDPNTLPKDKWLEMGLREAVVNAVMNYREKGGKFFDKDDLRKIYILKEEEFAVIEPFIKFEQAPSITKQLPVGLSIALNEADTMDLQQLPGIGPSFARRIVKYRDQLGGFYSREQLLEVYGMDSTRYAAIRDYVTADSAAIRKMNVNTITIKEMTRHPYFEFYVAKSILMYKNEIGKYTDIAQIRDARLVYDQLYFKIEPYLTIK
jgi:competence ComEA-like helix-hairpin-helix protein